MGTEDRPRTPEWHTLYGVLTQLQAGGAADPALASRLDRAFAKDLPALRKVCRRELRGFPEQVVDEVVQDTLLEAWHKLPEYRPDQPLRMFLWAIARWKCLGVRRRKRDVLSEDGVIETADEDLGVLAALTAEERDAVVRDAAAAVLDATEQQVVHLRWAMDYPREDVAQLAGLADAEAVRVTLVRCKRRLAREVARLAEERGLGLSSLHVPK